MIEPGARRAVEVSRSGRIGVIGTAGTIRSSAYTRAIKRLNPEAEVLTRACPLFVPLAEEGWVDNQVARLTAQTYLQELKEAGVDTLVLGCTHYPLLKPVIAEVMGAGVTLVDSAEETARTVAGILARKSCCALPPRTGTITIMSATYRPVYPGRESLSGRTAGRCLPGESGRRRRGNLNRMAPIRRRKISISLLIPFAIVALVFGVLIWKKMQDQPRTATPCRRSDQPAATRKAVLFFVADGTRLAREARELPDARMRKPASKIVLEELFSGPVGDLTKPCRKARLLNGVRLEGDLAVVDVNRAFADRPAVRQFGGDAGGLFDRQYGLLQFPADYQGQDHGRGRTRQSS